MELDEGRLATQVHKNEKAFVMLRTNVAQQVVLSLPLRLVAKGKRVALFLEDPAAYTSRRNTSRAGPSAESSPQLLTLCRCNRNAYALDNQLIYLSDRPDGRLLTASHARTGDPAQEEAGGLPNGTKWRIRSNT
jgi:hypothetical protein